MDLFLREGKLQAVHTTTICLLLLHSSFFCKALCCSACDWKCVYCAKSNQSNQTKARQCVKRPMPPKSYSNNVHKRKRACCWSATPIGECKTNSGTRERRIVQCKVQVSSTPVHKT